jgi:di/tricarboxylate transporter
MFEFTALGGLVLLTGSVYLLTVGRFLLPERVKPGGTLIDRFELAEYLTELVVTEASSLVGTTVRDAFAEEERDVLIRQIIRDGRVVPGPYAHRRLQAGDVLRVRTDRDTMMAFREEKSLDFAAEPTTEVEDDADGSSPQLVEVVVLPNATLTGESLASVRFRQRYDATVLAMRRSGRLQNRALSALRLRGGDTLLVQATEEAVRQLSANRNFVVTQEIAAPDFRTGKTPIALGIVAAVVLLAAVDLLPITITAMGGMVAMVLTGCLRPTEIYEAVDWNVIFMIAGIIPLGLALEQTGGAAHLASLIVPLADLVPMVLFAALFYLITAVITEFITNLGSVVLMFPVAIDVALQTGADPFAFVLLVVFSASDSLMTPVGYQTNLMVFNQGGYHFVDFLRVGVPLQLLLAAVTAVGIAVGWGY